MAKTVELQELAASLIIKGDEWSFYFAYSFLGLADGWLDLAWDAYADGDV